MRCWPIKIPASILASMRSTSTAGPTKSGLPQSPTNLGSLPHQESPPQLPDVLRARVIPVSPPKRVDRPMWRDTENMKLRFLAEVRQPILLSLVTLLRRDSQSCRSPRRRLRSPLTALSRRGGGPMTLGLFARMGESASAELREGVLCPSPLLASHLRRTIRTCGRNRIG